jgi:hypothetical protein
MRRGVRIPEGCNRTAELDDLSSWGVGFACKRVLSNYNVVILLRRLSMSAKSPFRTTRVDREPQIHSDIDPNNILRSVLATGHRHLVKSRQRTIDGMALRPAYFPNSAFAELRARSGDTGACNLLSEAGCMHLAHGEIDMDTPADLALAESLFA